MFQIFSFCKRLGEMRFLGHEPIENIPSIFHEHACCLIADLKIPLYLNWSLLSTRA